MKIDCPICGHMREGKTNTHIVPWFMIKKTITQGGNGVRGMDLTFTMSSNSFTKVYAGQSILPEKLEELNYSDHLEKDLSDPQSVDNVWCRKCEEYFSRLESIFSMAFNEKRFKSLGTGKDELVDGANYHKDLFQLFIQSVFYRCHLTGSIQLKPGVANAILENFRILFAVADYKLIKPNTQVDGIKHFNMLALRLSDISPDETEYIVKIGQTKTPYFVQAAKWQLLLYEKEAHFCSSDYLHSLKDI